MSDLTIPVALTDDGRIVHAHEGAKGRTFRCPGCKAAVTWRKCDEVNRRSHFAHRPDSPCGESSIHAAAKMLAAQMINDWTAGVARRPLVSPTCDQCGIDCASRPFPLDPSCSAVVEHTMESGLRPDVLAGGTAIEILHTHAIGEEKVSQFATDGVQWFEVHAAGLLEDPPVWRLARSSAGASVCVGCARVHERDEAYRAAVALVAQRAALKSEVDGLEGRRLTLADEVARIAEMSEAKQSVLAGTVAAKRSQIEALDAEIRQRKETGMAAIKERWVEARDLDAKIQARRSQLDDEEIKTGRRVWVVMPARGGFMRIGEGKVMDSDGAWVHWVADDGADHFARPDAIRWVATRGRAQ